MARQLDMDIRCGSGDSSGGASDRVQVRPITGIGKVLTYRIPGQLVGRIRPGMLVRIPLIKRTCFGLVENLGDNSGLAAAKLKFILGPVYDECVVTPELVNLAGWLQGYYAASWESTYETLLPAVIRQGVRPKVRTFLHATAAVDAAAVEGLRRRAPRQAELLNLLIKQSTALEKGPLLQRLGLSAGVVSALVGKGLLREELRHEERSAYDDGIEDSDTVIVSKVVLNDEQQQAVESIRASLRERTFKCHLLHGVTGSGKTEVYLEAMRTVVDRGQGVIFLVPEVALTPQTVSRLRMRLEGMGAKTVVWHSHLSAGERFDAWFSLASGRSQVVVGPRSAVFTPVRNLGLVIVDEEHEPAYKQEDSPRYNGRDVAIYRAMLNDATVVLGSATPSLESLYNVQTKDFILNRLTKRIDDRQLPVLELVDMRREMLKSRGPCTISGILAEKLIDRFTKKEQAILFINRRGYSRSMLCPDCGFIAECEHCSTTLTFHRGENRLKCHLCGYERRAHHHCPKCASAKIRWKGFGTQRVEEAVQKILPRARIVRMDADTMQKKNLFRHVLADFRLGRIDVLVGTQMIAKGLDFPNVTLVGLIDADLSLHVPDFRAAERTFQLVVQVAGRAGRGDQAGEVVIQTFTPSCSPIQFARRGDFEGFLEEELENRREYKYPPFRHLIRHIFRGRNEEKVAFYAEEWVRHLEKTLTDPMEIRGPAPAPLEKIKDLYRYHVWYFVGSVSRMVPQITSARDQFPMDKDIQDLLDVDPLDLS